MVVWDFVLFLTTLRLPTLPLFVLLVLLIGITNTLHAVDSFNKIVSLSEMVTVASILASPMQQEALSEKIEDHQFSELYDASTPADKERLLSKSAPHASSWLLVTPSTGLDLHLDPNELKTALKWWLGVDTARETSCSLCPDTALDWLGNHTATCKRGGDVVSRHKRLRDLVLEFCHRAHQVVRV